MAQALEKKIETPSEAAIVALTNLYARVAKELDRELLEVAASEETMTAAAIKARRARVAAILQALRTQSRPLIVKAALEAYKVGSDSAIERLKRAGRRRVAAEFTIRDKEAVRIIAENMVSTVEQAEALVGRRHDDVLRQIGLQQTAESIALGESRVEASERLARALERAGVTITDAGGARLVPINGRNYRLENYVEMVARTTTREAASHGTANRLLHNGLDLVTVDEHGTHDDLCAAYEGKTFSLTGNTPGYPVLDQMPPFHPNCKHVLTPAALV